MHKTILKGDGLLLRQWRNEDLADLLKCCQNSNIWTYINPAFAVEYSEELGKGFLQASEDAAKTDKPLTNFAVDVNGEAVGSIGFRFGEELTKTTAIMGYWIAEPQWGKGLATKAAQLLVNYAFDELNFHKLNAFVCAPNKSSMRVLKKIGFYEEAILKEQCVLKDGVLVDQHLFSKIRNK